MNYNKIATLACVAFGCMALIAQEPKVAALEKPTETAKAATVAETIDFYVTPVAKVSGGTVKIDVSITDKDKKPAKKRLAGELKVILKHAGKVVHQSKMKAG